METILGLIMIYSWVHSVAIIFNKVKDLTDYEKVVMWFGFVAILLYVIGTLY